MRAAPAREGLARPRRRLRGVAVGAAVAALVAFGAPAPAQPVPARALEAPPAGGSLPEHLAGAFGGAFRHATARANGLRLHYVAGGSGERGAVVLIHGFFETSYAWHKVAPILAAAGYAVVAPDMRGTGDSDKPETGYDARTVAEDIHQLVRGLGHDRVFVVGHDFGSLPAFAYAAAYPGEVRRLAILEEVIPGFGSEEIARKLHIWAWGFHQAPDIAEALVAGKERTYIAWFHRRNTFDRATYSEADLDEYARSYAAPGGMRGAFGHYRALPETERQNREAVARGRLAMPVLALGADGYMGAAVEASLRRVASDVRGGVVGNCGHYIPMERPEELARRLLAFFGEDPGDPGAAR